MSSSNDPNDVGASELLSLLFICFIWAILMLVFRVLWPFHDFSRFADKDPEILRMGSAVVPLDSFGAVSIGLVLAVAFTDASMWFLLGATIIYAVLSLLRWLVSKGIIPSKPLQ